MTVARLQHSAIDVCVNGPCSSKFIETIWLLSEGRVEDSAPAQIVGWQIISHRDRLKSGCNYRIF